MRSEPESWLSGLLNGRRTRQGFSSSAEDSSCFTVPPGLLDAARMAGGWMVLLQFWDAWLAGCREAPEFLWLLRRPLLLLIIYWWKEHCDTRRLPLKYIETTAGTTKLPLWPRKIQLRPRLRALNNRCGC